jgi:hypothetical protein
MATIAGPRETSIAIAVDEPQSYVDWGAIIAGTVLAAAVATLLLVFGSALGLSLTSAYPGRGLPPLGLIIAGALWILWVEITCFLAGGYLAGRLRRRVSPSATSHEVEVRDGSHGLLVWALSLIIGALITGATVSGVISLGGRAAGGAAAASDPSAYYVDALLRPAGPAQPASAAGASAAPATTDAATTTEPPAEAQAQAAPSPSTEPPARDAAPVSEADRQSVSRIFAMNASGPFADDDKSYLASLVAQRTGLSPEEAGKRVDDVIAKARAAAEEARKYGILVAFLYTASMLASAVAAWWAATLGGKHRDERADYSHFLSARR